MVFLSAHQVSQAPFRTVVNVQDRTKATILKHINTAFDLHNTGGFLVNELKADNEFACIKDQIILVSLNLVVRGSTVVISKIR